MRVTEAIFSATMTIRRGVRMSVGQRQDGVRVEEDEDGGLG